MAQVLGEMGKTVFDPLRDPLPPVGHQHGCGKQEEYERNQSVSREMNPLPDFRRRGFGKGAQLRGQKNARHQQDGKTADVKNSLHRPDRNLRGERQVLSAGYQIGTNQLTGPAEQGESGEPDQSGWKQSQHGCLLAHRAKENFPSPPTAALSCISPRSAISSYCATFLARSPYRKPSLRKLWLVESGSRTVWPSNASSLRRFVPGSTTFEGPDFGYATNTIASSLRALANSAILN